jgi:hypothetical protein
MLLADQEHRRSIAERYHAEMIWRRTKQHGEDPPHFTATGAATFPR